MTKNMFSSGILKRAKRYRQYLKDKDEEFWHDKDPAENKKGKLPDDENIQLPAIWVSELYTPSKVEKLLTGIQKLDWDKDRIGQKSLIQWMSEARQGRTAGWTSLGLVSSPEDEHFMRDRVAQLPPGVTAALPILLTLTPSITAIVIAFIFDEETANALNAPLSAYYSTTTTPSHDQSIWRILSYILFNKSMGFGRKISMPDARREEMTRDKLSRIERHCIDWVHQNLPGVFASDLKAYKSPTAILLLTEKVDPLTKEARDVRALQGLSLNHDFDAWTNNEWSGIRIALPSSWKDEGGRLTFACLRSSSFEKHDGYQNPHSNWTIAHRSDKLIQGLLSRWAITCLLDGYKQQLGVMRDRTANPRKYRVVKDLKQLRNLVRTTMYDVTIVAQDLGLLLNNSHRYKHNVIEPKRSYSKGSNEVDLLDELNSAQKSLSDQLLREANHLQTVLSATGNISQTISNLRVGRSILFLTVISICIALIAIAISQAVL